MVSGPQQPTAGVFTVQVGAFQQRENAERLRAGLLARYPDIFFLEFDTPAGHFYRVLVGRLATEQAAQQEAAKLTSEDGLQTFVVRMDTLQ
jgi:cell division septation protein DedD